MTKNTLNQNAKLVQELKDYIEPILILTVSLLIDLRSSKMKKIALIKKIIRF